MNSAGIKFQQARRFVMVLIVIGLFSWKVFGEETVMRPVVLTPQDRILILAPHPDDEVLGCGGIIQRALSMKLPVHIAFLTNGDSNQWAFLIYRKHPVFMPQAIGKMGMVRSDEALAAAQILGLSAFDLTFLGYPDLGTMSIWYDHWGKRPPFRSLLTGWRAVPYPKALRPGAPYKGEEIVADLKAVIRSFKPTKIFVSHPADHNGDHLACYLFMRIALWDLKLDQEVKVYPYLIHCLGWPAVKGLHSDQRLSPPKTLENQILWRSYELNEKELNRKILALKAHKSQYQSSAKYLLSFMRRNELFGDFSIVQLLGNEPAPAIAPEKKKGAKASEPVENSQHDAFVDVEWRFVRVEDDYLVISLKLSRLMTEGIEASVYVFGYRQDKSFDEMPKLHVKIGLVKYGVYDQNAVLPSNAIQIVRFPKEIDIRIPLKILGDPEKILTSVRTYLGNIPLDWISWRTLQLPKKENISAAASPN